MAKHYSIFILFCSLALNGISQDGHYWTEQYGTHSTYMGGSVIGSVKDLGAVYYNPGRLPLLEDPTFILSARVFQVQRLSIEDAVGENIDLQESGVGSAPNMLAGSFSLGEQDQHQIGYSLLTRFDSDLEYSIRTNGEGDIIDGLSGQELYAGEVTWNRELNERWLGITWSCRVKPNFGIGVSQFVSRRSQESQFDVQLQALSSNDEVSFLSRTRENEFTNYSLRWKIGMAANQGPFSFGLTLTTPNLNLSGEGMNVYEDFFAGIPTDSSSVENVFIANNQSMLNSRFRSPLSAGAGVGIEFKKLTIHTSIEWYNSVDAYAILSPEPFAGQINEDTIFTELIDARNSVVNFGLGAEFMLNDRVELYGSCSTDNSAVKASVNRFVELESRSNNAIMRADLMHLSAGAVVRTGNAELTLGGVLSFAQQEVLRTIDLPEKNSSVIFGSGQMSTVNFRRYRLIFGFSLPVSRRNR
jgi:hypothetical protein